MWKKSEGFTLLEVMGALVILMVITSLLLPGLVRMNQERKGFLLEQEARYILTDEMDKVRMGEFQNGPQKEIIKRKTTYRVELYEIREFPELCISYLDYRSLSRMRCVYVRLPQ